METTTRPGTPLRHRMLDDMRMRKMAEHTQAGYVRAVRKLAAFLGRSPDTATATAEDLRRFQLNLVDTGAGPVTINATITGLKFFFDITLGQPDLMAKMQHVNVPRKLPVILSPEEAACAGTASTSSQTTMVRTNEVAASLYSSDFHPTQNRLWRLLLAHFAARRPVTSTADATLFCTFATAATCARVVQRLRPVIDRLGGCLATAVAAGTGSSNIGSGTKLRIP